jgi:hypothetical protein
MGWSDEKPMNESAMKASNGAVKRLASYGRGRMMPALLNGFEADGLIQTGEADEAVDDGAEGRDYFMPKMAATRSKWATAMRPQFRAPTTTRTAASTSSFFMIFLRDAYDLV